MNAAIGTEGPRDLHQPFAAKLLATLLSLQPKAIAVYGLGVVSKNVLRLLGDFNVVGLMDKDPANCGKVLYGLPVLNNEEVRRAGVEAIIVASSEIYWRTISQRIEPFCIATGIRVVYLNGEVLDEKVNKYPLHSLDTRCSADLEMEIARHGVVSFDLFETLVTRLVSRPDDLLELALARARAETGSKLDLLAIRKAAEAVCCGIYGVFGFSLDCVYEHMRSANSLPHDVLLAMQRWELQVEISLTLPKPGMLDYLRHCVRAGKQVYITSDTHLPLNILESILEKCGLQAHPPLLLSWREACSKADGGLFDVLNQRHPGVPILHIGDNSVSDVDQAEQHGLTPFWVPSANELLLSSRLRSLLVHTCTTHDGVLLGIVARALFTDPFTRPLPDGRIGVGNLQRFGYLFFGPLLLAWLAWLARALQKRPVEKLLFFARDGYFLCKLYNEMRVSANLLGLPEGIYFATSRRMASVASLRRPEDVLALLMDAFSGSSEQLLRLRYGLDDSGASKADHLVNSDQAAITLVMLHMEAILDNARAERENYMGYVQRLGITPTKRFAVADLGIKGTIQFALQRMLGQTLDGYYITGFFGAENPYGMKENTAALFPQTLKGPANQIHSYHILCESVLTAPEGMYLRVAANGRFENAPVGMNQMLFAAKEEIHRGIEDFIADWSSTGIELVDVELTSALVDALYGQAMGADVDIAESVKQVFYVDECYRAETERRIWD